MQVELSQVQLSATLRIELGPLLPRLPGFGGLTLTFMKAPHIDFAVKVGSVDLLNIGPAEMNIGTIVRNMIGDIICNLYLYPKRMSIPLMDDNAVLEALGKPIPPKGFLSLTLQGAKKLKVADFLTSDPYVEISYMSEKLTSDVRQKTLNPVWNQTFELMVYEKSVQQIEFLVYGNLNYNYISLTIVLK